VRQPLGLILAGGQARRMGGTDKALLPLGSHRLIDEVLARFAPQVDRVAISANGDAARFSGLGLPVLPDETAGFPGPLAGVLSGLGWAAAQGGEALVTAAADTPFLPPDLVPRLILAAEISGTGLAVAATPGAGGPDLHPTFALWPVALRDTLARALAGGERRVGRVARDQGAAVAEFPPAGDPFFNVNTPEDLAEARRRMGG
jgi:molybdopterin-guanine dinucleotide biosynthesis protein A